MLNQNLRTYSAITLAMIFWAYSFIWGKQVLDIYPPSTVVLFRLSLAAILLFIFAKWTNKLQKTKKEDLKYFILLSFFEPFLYFIGESQGLKLVSSTFASVIIATIPLFIAIISFFFLSEKISVINLIGVFISIIGVLMIVFTKNMDLSAEPIGILFMFLAVFAAVGYTLVIKTLIEKYNIFTIVFWQNIIASIAFIPLFLFFDFKQFIQIGFSLEALKYIFLLAIFASNAAFILYTYTIKHIGITRSGVFSNLIPIITAILAFFILDEKLSLIKYIGIAVVVIGLIITQLQTNNSK